MVESAMRRIRNIQIPRSIFFPNFLLFIFGRESFIETVSYIFVASNGFLRQITEVC